MTRQDIVDAVCKRTGIEKTAANAVIEEAINVARESLINGKTIYIRGLFTLAPVRRKEKVVQDIGRKKSFIMPAHYIPHAKFSQKLVDEVRENVRVIKK